MSEDCSVLTHPDNREVCARLWLWLYPAKQDFAHPLTCEMTSMKIVLRKLSERVPRYLYNYITSNYIAPNLEGGGNIMFRSGGEERW